MLMSNRQSGFTMIEVLISLVVFAVAILGMSSLQIRSFSTSMDLSQRAVMTSTVQNLASRVRSNPEGSAAYVGTFNQSLCNAGPATNCSDRKGGVAASCTAAQVANFDRWAAFCGATGSSGLQKAVADWSISISCTDSASDCSAPAAQMRVAASWSRRRTRVDSLLTNTVAADVLDTGGSTRIAAGSDEMVLEFTPW